jgi:hypothetical protein
MFLEKGVNRLTQDAFPLTMDNSYLMNPLFVTGFEIFIHHGGRIFGGEHMQVENPVDRILDLIHSQNL